MLDEAAFFEFLHKAVRKLVLRTEVVFTGRQCFLGLAVESWVLHETVDADEKSILDLRWFEPCFFLLCQYFLAPLYDLISNRGHVRTASQRAN